MLMKKEDNRVIIAADDDDPAELQKYISKKICRIITDSS